MKIVGISGKKQSGKNTIGNILTGIVLKRTNQVDDFSISTNGELVIHKKEESGILDLSRKDSDFVNYASANIWPYIKIYSFADELKRVCVELFNIDPECVYGTDEQKNKIQQHLLWENMPGVTTDKGFYDAAMQSNYGFAVKEIVSKMVYHNSGPMTAREFMQFLGTEVMRKIYSDVWVGSTIRKIVTEQSQVAVICDVRFPNEADAIHECGDDGKNIKSMNIRLHRDTGIDRHSSELALDDYKNFQLHIDNNSLTLSDLMQKVIDCNLI